MAPSKRARPGRGTTASALPPARVALSQCHGGSGKVARLLLYEAIPDTSTTGSMRSSRRTPLLLAWQTDHAVRRRRASARRRLRSPRDPRRGDRVRHGAIVPTARLAPPHGRKRERRATGHGRDPDACFSAKRSRARDVRRVAATSAPAGGVVRVLPRDSGSEPDASATTGAEVIERRAINPPTLCFVVHGSASGERRRAASLARDDSVSSPPFRPSLRIRSQGGLS